MKVFVDRLQKYVSRLKIFIFIYKLHKNINIYIYMNYINMLFFGGGGVILKIILNPIYNIIPFNSIK